MLSLVRKTEGVIDGESEDGDRDKVNQEDSEQEKVDGMKKGADSMSLYVCSTGLF